MRIVGGDYVTDGYILNPLGVAGAIDTTSANEAYPDSTLNPVIIRANAWQSVTNLSTATGVFSSPGHRLTAGTPVWVAGSTQPGGFTASVFYYVVNPEADAFQLSATAGGAPVVPTTAGAGLYVREPNGQANQTALPGLAVAGRMTVNGDLLLPVVSGAAATNKGAAVAAPVFQPTLRVGGVLPVTNGVTVDAAADTLTLASGSVRDGQPVMLSSTSTVSTNMPGGTTLGQVYYVRDVAGSSFKLAACPGESAINLTNLGVSVVLVTARAAGSASLAVSGDLVAEGRVVTSSFKGGSLPNGIVLGVAAAFGDGVTVSVTNTTNHGLRPGDAFRVTGAAAAFNGTFTVLSAPSPLVFTYAAAATGSAGTGMTVTYSKFVSINVAIQSNAAVSVAGDVTIGGVGLPQNCLATGLGVGIDPFSQFTLNGGLAATQTVSIAPPVGRFHVGEGSGGVLDGAAANARLGCTLTVAGALDVNGAGSIVGADPTAGLTLTNGAPLCLNAAASVALAGPLTLCDGSVVDLSAGSVSAGTFILAAGGVVDLKDRADVADALRVAGDARPQLQAAISAGQIRSSRRRLAVRYSAVQDVTTVVGLSGTMIGIL